TVLGKVIANAIAAVPEDWAHATLRRLVNDESPVVSYRAALACNDTEFARQLLKSGSELKRLLGVRILWNVKEVDMLVSSLSDNSAAVRDAAIWSLGQIPGGSDAQLDALRGLVDTSDRLDIWNMNPAVLAWRGLARLGAVSAPPAKAAGN